MIRAAHEADSAAIAAIYNHYVLNTTATFEERAVPEGEIGERVRNIIGLGLPWIVAADRGEVIGYSYATPWKARSAYRYTVEVAIYVSPSDQGRGWGTRLYRHLFAELKEAGVHAVLAGITLPNDPSVALHEKLGMVKVAHLKEVGLKFDRWLDVGYWQLLIPQPHPA